ncbi:MAG: tetratricopeptide repeat protein [Bacteroidia bacterium]
MSHIEKIISLFEEIKKGNHSLRDEFFETVWVNSTRLAHNQDVNPFLKEMKDWANTYSLEHPDFFEHMNLSLGFIEFLADNFDVAMKHLNKAHDLFSDRKDEDGMAACSICIGFLRRSTGEIDLALKYGLQGLEQLEKTGKYKMFQLLGCYFIGGLYADTGHLEEALRLFQEGLKIDHPAGIESLGARLTNGIAGVYMKQKNFTLALENYQKALDSYGTNTELTFRARGLTDLGDYYAKMGNYEQAMHYNQEALAIRQEMKIQNGSITNFMNLGDIYNKQGKFNEAIEVLIQALKLAEEIGVKVKMYQIHELLSDIFLATGNATESLAHHRAFHEIKEDVNHEDMDRKVKNQVQLFQAQQTQKENAIIKAQKIEIETKNIELQETIDELTLARINKKARAFTLSIAIVLFIFQDRILEMILHAFASHSYWLSLFIKVGIIFSLEPVNKAIEHYLLRKVIKKKKKEVLV